MSSALPALAVLLPMLGALAVQITGSRNEKLRNILAIAFSGGAFAVCCAMFPAVMARGEQLSVSLPVFLGDFVLTVDSLGLVFALVSSFLWVLSTLYSYSYIQHEERRTRYHTFALLTEAATLGVFLAGNFFVLFVFFELMGMLAYLLVVHSQTYEARRAGSKYIFMTVYGGLSLLFGVMLFTRYAGGLGFTAAPDSAYLTGSICFVVAGFMIGGFGVKAGMVPLHVWLPLAHPAAPSPASALLSGVMIKAGAYGFLRIVQTFMSAPGAHGAGGMLASHGEPIEKAAEHAPAFMRNLHSLGIVIIVFALLTMVVGMVLALVQDNAKRLLAYSSISQMGFILLGVGVAAYLGAEGSAGLAGSIYHVMNHAMFKGLLFLGVGAVYYRTHELDMTKLGGLWRKMPVTTVLTCIAGLGIMGIAIFNGYVSKTLLHHSIVESLNVGHAWIRAVDAIFIISAGGTICYIAKLLTLTFFGRSRGESREEVTDAPWPMLAGMSVLAGGVVFFGVFPGFAIRNFVIPALRPFTGLDPAQVHHLAELKLYIVHDLLAILPPLAVGLCIFLVAMRWDLFRLRLPKVAGIDYYYTRAEVGFLRTCFAGSRRYAELRAKYWPLARSTGEYLVDWWAGTRKRYRDYRRAVLSRVVTLPMDVEGFTTFVRAKQFTGDIAFGVGIIAGAIALLVLILV